MHALLSAYNYTSSSESPRSSPSAGIHTCMHNLQPACCIPFPTPPHSKACVNALNPNMQVYIYGGDDYGGNGGVWGGGRWGFRGGC